MFTPLRKQVAEPQPKMKFGFTLAEVLITLGIIGIVAAMTIPTLIQNCSKEATGSNAGYYCLMKIKNNGWEIPKDVWNIKVR